MVKIKSVLARFSNCAEVGGSWPLQNRSGRTAACKSSRVRLGQGGHLKVQLPCLRADENEGIKSGREMLAMRADEMKIDPLCVWLSDASTRSDRDRSGSDNNEH